MTDLLESIIAQKKIEVREAKGTMPLREVKSRLKTAGFRFARKNRGRSWLLIAECKLQSPAKGRLCTAYTVPELAKIYAENGAAALSVHTDRHFLGDPKDIRRVKDCVELPILRKDFIIDEYQLYQSRLLGADAVLLIARILSPQQIKEYVYMAWSLGMDALVEIHSEADAVAAFDTPAEFIGINNRNLQNFTTDVKNTLSLLPFCDKSRTIISESGVKDRKDALLLRENGVKGVLVGEGLVKAGDIAAKTRELALF